MNSLTDGVCGECSSELLEVEWSDLGDGEVLVGVRCDQCSATWIENYKAVA